MSSLVLRSDSGSRVDAILKSNQGDTMKAAEANETYRTDMVFIVWQFAFLRWQLLAYVAGSGRASDQFIVQPDGLAEEKAQRTAAGTAYWPADL